MDNNISQELIGKDYWEPLWGNQRMKKVNQETEAEAILGLLKLAGLDQSKIDLVVDHSGGKTIRVKIFKGAEYSIELFDYLFYGPLVFANNKTYLRKSVIGTKDSDDHTSSFTTTKSIMIEPEEIASKIKADIAAIYEARKEATLSQATG